MDASTTKASKKDKGGGKIKLKRPSVKLDGKKHGSPTPASAPSPIVNELEDKEVASFATGQPLLDEPELVMCKHCKKAVLHTVAVAHLQHCAKQKQEKLKKKKEVKEAAAREREAKEKGRDAPTETPVKDTAGKAGEEADSAEKVKSAKKSAVPTESKTIDDSTKKSKKRKADADAEKGPKAKKKKEEPKPKLAKPKGPVDVEKQCGVPLPNGAQCARSLTCKSHSMGAKRAVPGRSLPYDMLLSVYQKKNQAKQQKAAIDANAPLQDELDGTAGPIDSDEEKDAIMAAIARSRPQPLEQHMLMPTRRKYQYVRMKGLLSGALGGSRGGGLFSTGDAGARVPLSGSEANIGGPFSSSPVMSAASEGTLEAPMRRPSLMQQAVSGQNRAAAAAGSGGGQRKALTPTVASQA
ncbi:MAG: Dcp1p-Dcp2p decapping enzyme complex alpha subunit [Thelocarpon superellum]|nr:MAG: Dcp1p-Dcp2p decapping enzyme complex alpha subunit [Thelocarpon superellum]